MSNIQRYALLGLAAAVLVVGFFVFRDAGDDSGGASTVTEAITEPRETTPDDTVPREAPAATTEAEPEQVEPAKPAVPTIRVRGGEPVGGVETLEYAKGDEVDFRVRSDAADDIHVHGYDLERSIAAGGTVRFRFAATIEGRFEVELHHSGAQIAELEVQP